MSTTIKLRRDTAANWTIANPTLALGEPGIETDTGKIKYGTGTTPWNSLRYFSLLNLGIADGSNNQVLTTNGNANFTFVSQVSNALVAGTVYTNAQPNITSVGNLTSLTVTGNTTTGNLTNANLVSANYLTGTLTTASQPNITSVGNLTSLTVTGNINSSNANLGNIVVANYFSGNGSLLFALNYANLTGKPSLSNVATSGNYADLSGKPSLFSGNYADLSGKPSLFSGNYADLSGSPSLSNVATSGNYADLSGSPSLSNVATSGNYADLSNKPTIPDAQIQSDWTQTDNTLKDFIKNKPTLVTNLDSLSDVTISSATNGQVLKFNGIAWVNDTDSTSATTYIDISILKTLVAASTDFADFQTRISAL